MAAKDKKDTHLQMYDNLPPEHRIGGYQNNNTAVKGYSIQQPIHVKSDSRNRDSGQQHCGERRLQRQDALSSTDEFFASKLNYPLKPPSREDTADKTKNVKGRLSNEAVHTSKLEIKSNKQDIGFSSSALNYSLKSTNRNVNYKPNGTENGTTEIEIVTETKHGAVWETKNGTADETKIGTVPKTKIGKMSETKNGAVSTTSASGKRMTFAQPCKGDQNTLPSSTGSEAKDVLRNSNEFRKSDDDTFEVATVNSVMRCVPSVGWIVADKSTGTCFRVGKRYIMTTYHLIEGVLAMFINGRISINQWEMCVFVRFGYIDKTIISHNIPILSTPIFVDANMDMVILELKDCGIVFPPPLHLDSFEDECREIHLIGHPDGNVMKIDPRCRIVSLTEDMVLQAQQWSLDVKKTNGYEGIDDSSMLLFHCIFQHGASGSPGLVIGPCKEPRVVTMLMKGYPSFYWELSYDQQKQIPPNFLIEQGIRMSAVRELMNRDPNLREVVTDIFKHETTV